MASNRHPRPARGFGKSRWPDALLAAMDQETPFDVSWTHDPKFGSEFASALRGPTHVKIANRLSGGFNVDAKLDASQVQDRRSDRAHYVPNANNHAIAERKARLRKAKILKNATAGDGRLERPAPHGPDVQYVGEGDAGSRHTRRVLATKPGETLPSTRPKPKKKSKTRFNQGRHDA